MAAKAIQDGDYNPNEGDDNQPKSLIFHLAKQLTNGQDLTRVLIPTFFLEPRSLLEKYCDLWAHPQFVLGVSKEEDPLKRITSILKWYVSGWHFKPRGVRKPYNPLLGEVFYCYWDHEDGSRSFYSAEQVSHHPPVSAVYIENRRANIAINASIHTKSKFYGNSAGSIQVGRADFHVLNLDENYEITFPTIYACGLFIGTLRMEIAGECSITCKKTGYTAKIEFHFKPTFGGDYNRVSGSISKDGDKEPHLTFEGSWDGVITSKDRKGTEEILFDAEKAVIQKKFVMPLDSQGDFESRKLWKVVAEAIRKADHETATAEKTRLEDAQRARRKEMEEKKIEHVPALFAADESGFWTYKKINLKPYDPKEEKEEVKQEEPKKDEAKKEEAKPVVEEKKDAPKA